MKKALSQFSMQLNSNSLEQEEETFMPMMLISFSSELKISFAVVNIVFSLVVLLFVIRVLYQVDRPLSTPSCQNSVISTISE